MLIDNTELYEAVWARVYRELGFKPSCYDRSHSMANPPFRINQAYAVYGIENMGDAEIDIMDEIISGIFSDVSDGVRMYALDWQHSGFLYSSSDGEELKSYRNGNTDEHFPDYCPDGDYYFFIDENFRFGYLSHPWRQEVWVFGEPLLQKFDGDICRPWLDKNNVINHENTITSYGTARIFSHIVKKTLSNR